MHSVKTDLQGNSAAQKTIDLKNIKREVVEGVAKRAHYLATQMIYQANHREDKEKGDPKIGGHISGSASALHIMGALHLIVKTGFDHIANKPHASPTDHAYNYLLDLLLKKDLSRLTLEECNTAMMGLRKYSHGEPVFQSYHSAYDPDHHNFFPSGTVGIPPVQAGYLALAYRYAKEHGYEIPDAHFWCLSGDSEFREGSMYEAVPDFAEREIGNVTWIVDYNRQSLDGHRITNEQIMQGTDADRIERTMAANGWQVIQVRHGSIREKLFKKPGGEVFRKFLEKDLKDYELQSLLLVRDIALLKQGIAKEHPAMKKFLDAVGDDEFMAAIRDFGGHDIMLMAEAMLESKKTTRQPTIIIAHTLKGWNLKMAAAPGNHSALITEEEINSIKEKYKIPAGEMFSRFDEKSEEGKFCRKRGEDLLNQIKQQHSLKDKNQKSFLEKMNAGELPVSLEINTKMTSYPHTQWMLGQLTAKLTRIANQKDVPDKEKAWKIPGELFVTMAPDVGTSTNLNPAMDGKIFGAPVVEDIETEYGVKDTKLPDLVPGEDVSDRYIRFEIAEANVMSCVGSFGKIRDTVGIPLVPLMTVYDFFIKRAHDQYFYNLYWKSSFICVGTPSGVTLSPEGAQHGWKSDFQIPNQITWEPFFCQELDWIFCDTIKRHLLFDNEGRNGALLRLVTRGVEQKDMMVYLKKQVRFKSSGDSLHRAGFPMDGAVNEEEVGNVEDAQILETIRTEVLAGAYYLIDYRGYAGYSPGDNVVHIFSMGAMTTEAINASEELLKQGIYANVIVVTSSDLLCGGFAHDNNYDYLKNNLGVNANLYLRANQDMGAADVITVSGQRIPIVSVHDGEPGLLDNLGAIIGVKHISCAVRKHSKCGRPAEIYQYHGIDGESVKQACLQVLEETAMEETQLSASLLKQLNR
ncbi:MAG: pyruvate dehydrogenase [Bdellovibrionota bacterium]